MAFDVPRKRSGLPPLAIVVVILIAAAVGFVGWQLKQQNDVRAAVEQSLTVPPESVSRFSDPYKAPAGAQAGVAGPARRSRGAGPLSSRGDETPAAGARGENERKPAAVSPRPLAPAATTRSTEDLNAAPTYDASDAEVTAPKLVAPLVNLPAPPQPPRKAPPSAIEILVNEDGTVDAVKATFYPGTVGENLQVTHALSVAKTWRFEPAARNGRPVKYRLLVPLSMF